MAKNYTDSEQVRTIVPNNTNEIANKAQSARNRLIDLIMERVENGSNIDYIVKLSEVYRNLN